MIKTIPSWLRCGIGYLFGLGLLSAVAPGGLSFFVTTLLSLRFLGIWFPEIVAAYLLLWWFSKGIYGDVRRGPFLIEGIWFGLLPCVGFWPTYFWIPVMILIIGGIRYGIATTILMLHYLLLRGLRLLSRRKFGQADSGSPRIDSQSQISKRRRQIVTFSLIVGSIVTIIGLLLLQDWKPTEVRKFPENFRGNAIIVWSIPGYAPLPIEHGKWIENFPSDGIIVTSSAEQFGFGWCENYIIRKDGRCVAIADKDLNESSGRTTQGNREMQFTTIVVGSFTPGSEEDSRLFKDSQAKIDELFRRLANGSPQ